MTFSLVARCARTGMTGVALSSSAVVVASRCAWAAPGVGAVATLHITDPRLGSLGLELLGRGYGAPTVRDALVATAGAEAPWRQLAVVDRTGRTACFTGARCGPVSATAEGRDCASGCNVVANEGVPRAMVAAFEASAPALHLAERLLRALEAGLAAGGEHMEERAAGLKVVDREVWPLVDLRVDWHERPVAELRRIWTGYEPHMASYVARALDPDRAPPIVLAGARRKS
ncbi:MAG: DUF1028 domain-containing protein [Alphaproteobacteria bacterium]|nr:DUF1028 domain-containing protein [Alphaproteobacteria bacterium]